MSKSGGISETVANQILHRLTSTGNSVNHLAAQTGIPRSTLDRHLKITPKYLTLGQIEEIADALDVSFEYLLDLDLQVAA